MPAQQESQIPQSTLQSPAITSSDPDKNKSPKKIIIAIASVIILMGAVFAGVILVKRQQELRELASSASECTHSPDCVVFEDPGNEGFREVNRYISHLFITNKPGEEVKFEPNGGDNGCYKVEIDNNSFRWERYSSGNSCKDISNIQVWMEDLPEPTATPMPTPTTPPPASCNQPCTNNADCQESLQCISKLCRNPQCSEEESCVCPEPTATPTDVPNNITAVCNEVKAYDTSWNVLSSNDLKQLEAGDMIRFSVSGSATEGVIEKARFTINTTAALETTEKKPSTEEFFIEYEIPEGQLDFNVKGEVYHSTLGWF
ncbi:hypothetical protein JXA63_04605 [Candidatus Woesebacteria bacterium]|nr:hypothetical protein [Candidatus Woesebacteria bacterium]